jgi:hypothetical protein
MRKSRSMSMAPSARHPWRSQPSAAELPTVKPLAPALRIGWVLGVLGLLGAVACGPANCPMGQAHDAQGKCALECVPADGGGLISGVSACATGESCAAVSQPCPGVACSALSIYVCCAGSGCGP